MKLQVQSLRQNKEEEDDFATIVLNGAKAVFEDKDENDIVYSGEALDKMISELESREKPENDGKGAGFTFAPVYDTVQNSAGELPDLPENAEQQDSDFWADVLRRVEDETRAKEAEMYGAGKRSRGKQVSKKILDPSGHSSGEIPQISYTGHDIDQDQAQPTEVDKEQGKSRVEDDAGSQGSDFELDRSEISDAGVKDDFGLELETEIEQLMPPASKRRKRVPARQAPSHEDKNYASDSGPGKANGNTVEPDGQRQRGKYKKQRLSLGEQETSTTAAKASKGVGASEDSAVAAAKIALAKTQLTRLRYAAADCNVTNYPGKVSMVLSPQLEPDVRWEMYVALANEVDNALEHRSLEPIFSKSEFMKTLLPLFYKPKGEPSSSTYGRNGASPALKKIMPSGSSMPSTGTSKLLKSQRKNKDATPTERTSAPKAHASSKTSAETKKRTGSAAKGGPAPVGGCFFCSVSRI